MAAEAPTLTGLQQIENSIHPTIPSPTKEWESRVKMIEADQPRLAAVREQQDQALKAQAEQVLRAKEAAAKAQAFVPTPVTVAVSSGNLYTAGNCTWYVASRRSVPSDWGNASNWLYAAQASGWETGTTPRVGAIAQTSVGYAGHVAYVEQIAGDMVQVSEMNVLGLGIVDRQWYPASNFNYIY